jgi:hypothetical protein
VVAIAVIPIGASSWLKNAFWNPIVHLEMVKKNEASAVADASLRFTTRSSKNYKFHDPLSNIIYSIAFSNYSFIYYTI